MKKVIGLVLIFSNLIVYSQSSLLIPILQKDKWGYCDTNKQIIIKPSYSDARPFDGKYAFVAKSGKWGAIDRNNKEVLPFIYDEIEDFYDGFARIIKDNMEGILNRDLKIVIPVMYSGFTIGDGAYIINNGFAISRNTIIDTNGKIITQNEYDEVGRFSEGLFAVSKNNKTGFIDVNGKLVIPLMYDNGCTFLRFEDGIAKVQLNGKYGFIDQTNKVVIPFIYDYTYGFSEGLAATEKDEKWGFIDNTGKEVIPFIYSGLGNFSEGLVSFKEGEYWDYMDKAGKVIIPAKFDYAYEYRDNIAVASKNDISFTIKRDGTKLNNAESITRLSRYDDKNVPDQNYYLSIENDFKEGIISKSGKVVFPAKYENIDYSIEFQLFIIQESYLKGIINTNGDTILPFEFSEIKILPCGLIYTERQNDEKKGVYIPREENIEGIFGDYYIEKGYYDVKGRKYF